VYAGDYEIGANEAESLPKMFSERLLGRDEFVAEAKGRTVVSADTGLAEILQAAGIRCEVIDYPGSAMATRLGWKRILRGQAVRPEDLEANYIRRSDAEIFSQPKA